MTKNEHYLLEPNCSTVQVQLFVEIPHGLVQWLTERTVSEKVTGSKPVVRFFSGSKKMSSPFLRCI